MVKPFIVALLVLINNCMFTSNDEPIVITVPEDTILVDTVPEDTIPVDTVPEDTIPVDTVPEDTIPVDTVPVDTNSYPLFDLENEYASTEGLFVSFKVEAKIPRGDSLSDSSVLISIDSLPSGAKFNSGKFTWWPDFLSAGLYKIVFTAKSDTLVNTHTVNITVKDSLVSYGLLVQPIFNGQCIECHNPEAQGYTQTGDTLNGLDLTQDSSWASLVNQPTYQIPDYSPQFRVLPFDTSESYLLQKSDPDQTPKFGEIMPFGGFGGYVEPYNLSIISAWILEGALDN